MKRDDPILRKCRAALESLYRTRLAGLVLFGSAARGTEVEESDIDLMVLLHGPVNSAKEIQRIWEVLYPIQLECDRVISIVPTDVWAYRSGRYALYRQVLAEGISI